MKKDIHPTYYPHATITCACGNVLKTGATQEHLQVEICSACHPFYTGKEKIIDTAGRVEKFRSRIAQRKIDLRSKAQKHKKKREKKEKKNQE